MDNLEKFGFCQISREEFLKQTEEQVKAMPPRTVAEVTGGRKKGSGRKKIVLNATDVLLANDVTVVSSDDEDDVRVTKTVRSHHYKNWFNRKSWPTIDDAIHRTNFSPRETVRFLKIKYSNFKGEGPYSRLNESTIRQWLLKDGRRGYTDKVKLAIASIDHEETVSGAGVSLQKGRTGVWSTIPHVEKEFVVLLKQLRESYAGLNSVIIQVQMKAFLQVKAPDALRDNGGPLAVSRSFVRNWIQKKMNWTFRKITSDSCGKTPDNAQELGQNLVHRLAYLVTAYNIPVELVVNADQTGLHLIPLGDEKTYTMRGAKSVLVSGGGDKRQITVMLACNAAGGVLPGQVIFEDKTQQVVPDGEHATLLRHLGWNLTMSLKHWSTVDTMKEWVLFVYLPYTQKVCQQNGLDPIRQKSVLLVDCFSVHRSEEFMRWMKSEHANICMLFIPARCTSLFQPCDLALARPFKALVHKEFSSVAVSDLVTKLQAGVGASEMGLDSSIHTLRKRVCCWLWKAYTEINTRPGVVEKGWQKAGLLSAWGNDAQREALVLNIKGSLFSGNAILEVKEKFPSDRAEEWLGDVNIEELFKDASMIDLESIPPQDPSPAVPSLVNFIRSSHWKRINFAHYLSDPHCLSPYVRDA